MGTGEDQHIFRHHGWFCFSHRHQIIKRVKRHEKLGPERMIFHHSDGQWKRVRNTPKNIHHRPSSVSFNIDACQIMKTVRGTLVD